MSQPVKTDSTAAPQEVNAAAQLFGSLVEVCGSRQCLAKAREAILKVWPLTADNQWAVSAPPAEIVEALQLLDAAAGHLAGLQEDGPIGYLTEASSQPGAKADFRVYQP